MNAANQSRHALVVYESMFGNTAQVAEAIAKGLRAAGYDVEHREVTSGEASDVDLLVLGAPTHAFSLSRASTRADAVRQGAPSARAAVGLREWLARARPAPQGRPLVAVFDTRVEKVRLLPAAAGPTAARLAKRRGFRILGKPAGFLVEDTTGPLCDGELERAMRFGQIIGEAADEVLAEGAPPRRARLDARRVG